MDSNTRLSVGLKLISLFAAGYLLGWFLPLLETLGEATSTLEKRKALAGLATLAPVFTFLLAVVAALVAWRRLREATQTRNLTAVLDRLGQVGSSASIRARRKVYAAYTENPWSFKHSFECRHDPALLRAVDRVITDLGELGILIDKKLFEPELAWSRLGTVPIRMWYVLGVYVCSREDKASNPPPIALARLVDISLRYYRTHTGTRAGEPITGIITIHNDADRTKDVRIRSEDVISIENCIKNILSFPRTGMVDRRQPRPLIMSGMTLVGLALGRPSVDVVGVASIVLGCVFLTAGATVRRLR